MEKLKSFVHTPREVLVAETTRGNQLLTESKLELFNENNDPIGSHTVKRRYEYNGAGNLYTSDVIKYVCTHEPQSLKDGFSRYSVRLTWSACVKRAIGDRREQYHRLCKEIWRTIHEAKPCYIPKAGGGWYLMQPFIIDIESEDGKKLSDTEKKRLSQLGVEKLGHIVIHFAKPLFQSFIDGGQFFQYPANLYAQVHHLLTLEIEYLNSKERSRIIDATGYVEQLENLTAREVKKLLKALKEEELKTRKPLAISSEDFEFNVISAIDFLYLHGAGDKRKSYLDVDVDVFTKSCFPSMGYEKNGTFYTRIDKQRDYLTLITVTVSKLNGLDFKIEDIKNPKKRIIRFILSHPENKVKQKKRP